MSSGHHTCRVTGTRARLTNLAREPRRIPAAALRRLLPRSERYGLPWLTLPDGSVTFRERGFVAATSPAMLLARHNYELRRIDAELSDRHFRRSLEVGCGFGRLSSVIATHSDAHIAIDINDRALSAARAAYPLLDFREECATVLPFSDGQFDLIITWTVLQHVKPDSIANVCRELLRTLSGDGTVLICEETRWPEASGAHTWHRRVTQYEQLFAPLKLVRHGQIEEIAAIPGMDSPGEVMVFRAR